MSVPRLYQDLAHLWPRISPPADYAPEAAMLRELFDAHQPGPCRSILELGAGGGHTLSHLAPHYECVAVDLSPAMLELCRRLNPSVETVVGDMRDVRLGRTFDAVVIHDAIDYLTTRDDLQRTFATVSAHLPMGGLALIAPTYTDEIFTDGETEHDEHDGLAYDAVVRRTGDAAFDLVMTYHIGGEVVEDVHRCGLFSRRFWVHEMRNAGFVTRRVENDLWELFTGVRAW